MARQGPRRGSLIVIEGPDALVTTQVCEGLVDRLRREPNAAPVLLVAGHTLSSKASAQNADLHDEEVRLTIDAGGTAIIEGPWRMQFATPVPPMHALNSVQGNQSAQAPNGPPLLFVRLNPEVRHAGAPVGVNIEPQKRNAARCSRIEIIVNCLDNIAIVDCIVARVRQNLSATPIKDRDNQLSIEFKPMVPLAAPEVIVSKILPLKHTVAYETYWRFAAERQRIFFKRINGEAPPWTDDPILHSYKFTNAYRASDRVSQYLIRKVIYRDDLPDSPAEVFFRTMLFKFFNKIETWHALESALGTISYAEFSFDRYDAVLARLLRDGQSIYSAAYIMPSGGRASGFDRKHQHHLSLLQRMMSDSLADRLCDAPSMQRAFSLLKNYPSLGDFLAYQYTIDINYSGITNFSESDFVMPGPGALDGVQKCFTDAGGLNAAEVIKFMVDRQELEFERRGIRFESLWGRRLQLIDCQNLFCEVDKYSRVRHPELAGISGRMRIKQKFAAKTQFPAPWYPPKWKINSKIAATQHVPESPQGDGGMLWP